MPTYSYSATRGDDLDKARELLGACDVTDAELALRSDEDILAILARDGLVTGVAWLASALYAEFAQQPVRTSIGGKSIDYTDRLKSWDKLAAPLRQQLATQGQRPPPPPAAQVGALTAGATTIGKLR